MLLELAQRSKGLEPMLDAVFSFLKRKTDFYVEQGPGDRVGFPPGEAQKIVLRCFSKFATCGGSAPDKKLLETMGTRLQNGSSGAAHRPSQQPQQSPAAHHSPAALSSTSQNDSAPLPLRSPPAASPPATVAPPTIPTSALPHYNGAALETYAWSQTLTDVTISIPISPPCTARTLSVSIEKCSVSVQLRACAPSFLLQGDLPHDINASESVWSLDGSVLVSRSLQFCAFSIAVGICCCGPPRASNALARLCSCSS